jgi:hypothetical protein
MILQPIMSFFNDGTKRFHGIIENMSSDDGASAKGLSNHTNELTSLWMQSIERRLFHS